MNSKTKATQVAPVVEAIDEKPLLGIQMELVVRHYREFDKAGAPTGWRRSFFVNQLRSNMATDAGVYSAPAVVQLRLKMFFDNFRFAVDPTDRTSAIVQIGKALAAHSYFAGFETELSIVEVRELHDTRKVASLKPLPSDWAKGAPVA